MSRVLSGLVVLLFMSSSLVKADVSLSDLGLSESEVQLTPKQINEQKELEVRHRTLKTHEVLGLTTIGVMTAAMFTGNAAMENDLHMYLGLTSAALYYTTAYFAFTAPKPAGIKERGNIVWHKRLAWIHFPAMLLTPVLGLMRKHDLENNKSSNALVREHPSVVGVGYVALVLSAALMTFEF